MISLHASPQRLNRSEISAVTRQNDVSTHDKVRGFPNQPGAKRLLQRTNEYGNLPSPAVMPVATHNLFAFYYDRRI